MPSRDTWPLEEAVPTTGRSSPVFIRGAPRSAVQRRQVGQEGKPLLSSIHQGRLTTVNFGVSTSAAKRLAESLPFTCVLQGCGFKPRRASLRINSASAAEGLARWRLDAGCGGLRNPDSLGGGTAQNYGAGGAADGQRLVVISRDQLQAGSGANTAGLEKFEQLAITLVDAADFVAVPGLSVGKQDEAAMAAAGWTLLFAEIAVRACASAAELGQQFGFEVGRDRVLKPLGLVVNLPPLHAEKFRQHALDEVMPQRELAGDFAAGGVQANLTVGLNADESVFSEPAQRHGDRGRRHTQPVGEAGGDDFFALALSSQDGFQVVFFGNRDHAARIIRGRLSMVNRGLLMVDC